MQLPDGKEVDAIHGDFALANDQVVAVVAHPRRGRNANMTVREVGGCLIDLTRRDHPNDQLSAYYPGAQLRTLRFAGIEVEAPEVYETAELDRVFVRGKSVTLRLVASPRDGRSDVEVAYTLQDGWPYVLVTTTFTNRSDKDLDAELLDSVRRLIVRSVPRLVPMVSWTCSGSTTGTLIRHIARRSARRATRF